MSLIAGVLYTSAALATLSSEYPAAASGTASVTEGSCAIANSGGISVAAGQRVRLRLAGRTSPVVLPPGAYEMPTNRFTPKVIALLSAFPVASLWLDGEGRPQGVALGGSLPPCLMEAARHGPVTLDWVLLDEHGNTIAYRLAQP